ncbi:hypothetical protein LFL96_13665 [Paraburkholderia sp. D15]|uniref:hypothetical protein n=1 Tax=Paraburkholderia sp. D15 TaxID=2880218 RepID=UPI002479AE5F|nr:hypothetical protein [Paraburkholderia sp. D15]WGS48821.1 hypothetical protein LFL96_13665 [Paraburkholderia sp. D15]
MQPFASSNDAGIRPDAHDVPEALDAFDALDRLITAKRSSHERACGDDSSNSQIRRPSARPLPDRLQHVRRRGSQQAHAHIVVSGMSGMSGMSGIAGIAGIAGASLASAAFAESPIEWRSYRKPGCRKFPA